MIRNVLGAAFAATLLLTVPAGAATTCPPPPDPVGDVTLDDGGPVVDGQKHLDIIGYDIAVGAKSLVAVIRLVEITNSRLGTWQMEFTSGSTKLFVTASRGAHLNSYDENAVPGFRAGAVGTIGTTVAGKIGLDGVVKIVAPLTAFGKAAPKRTTRLKSVTVEASEKFLTVGPVEDVKLVDYALWDGRTRRCS